MTLTLIEEEKTIAHSGSEKPLLPEATNSGGRPSKYRTEFAEAGHKYSLLGATNERIAEDLRVSRQTIYNWPQDLPEFREPIRDDHARVDADVAASFYRGTSGGARNCASNLLTQQYSSS